MQGTNECKSKVSKWKEKAKARSKEKSALKKRLTELKESRDNWKSKYQLEKSGTKVLKKAIREFEKKGKRLDLKSQKPKFHSYKVETILLCIWLRQKGNCSLRSCVSILSIIGTILSLEFKIPSRNSIQNWEKKLGYHQIVKQGNSDDSWIIILDESISIGRQKLLLILGVKQSHYQTINTLSFQDTEVLYLGISDSWKGTEIAQQINQLKKKGFHILYGVSDGGKNLCKALEICELVRIADCTHAMGNLLKKQHKLNEEYLSFSKKCGALRTLVLQGKDAAIMPPQQRVKGRFLNLEPLCNWAYKMLLLLQKKESKLTLSQQEKLQWLEDYNSFILEIYEQSQTMNQIFKILKKEGLIEDTVSRCKLILNEGNCVPYFKQGVIQYLDKNLEAYPTKNKILCCSDIIESYFGKYKNQLTKTNAKLITESCLCIANFNQIFSEGEVKRAMESVKIIDIKNWRLENLPKSLIQEKRELLKSAG